MRHPRSAVAALCCIILCAVGADAATKADVVFSFDSTGSMGAEIANLKTSLVGTIIPGIKAAVPDVAFGLVDFRDFGETPTTSFLMIYRHRIQTVSTSPGVTSFSTAVNELAASGGGDDPEAGWEALYSIAGGPAITVAEYTSTFNLAATNPTTPTPGETQGTDGGAGFRTGAVPIVIVFTDAEFHDAPGSGGLNPYPAALAGVPSRADAIGRLNAIGAKVISLVSSGGAGNPRLQGQLLAEATGAVVATTAWDPTRPAGCASGQCCTGLNGSGMAPSNGLCPLVYSLDSYGTGLGTAVVDGVRALVPSLPVATSTSLASDLNPSTAGDTVTFTATVVPSETGTPTGTVTFRDGTNVLGSGTLSAGQATFSTSMLTAGSHTITATYEGDTHFSGSTSPDLTQVVQAIPAPTGLVASADSDTSVMVSWTASAGATNYKISRSIDGTSFENAGTSNTAPFHDMNVASGVAYLYIVQGIDGTGGLSAPSNQDLATTITFADQPLGATTPIKADYLIRLRQAVQAVCDLAAVATNFTDAIIDSTVPVRAEHITQLRTAIDAALSNLHLGGVSYGEDAITAGSTTIKRQHMEELRLAVN